MSSDNQPGTRRHRTASWLFTRLALQNLLRRKTRTLMLLMAVGLGTGAVFASYVVARGIEASMEQGFARMGADLVVVPAEAMVNITSALLTVQPTEATIDAALIDEIAKMDGVAQVAPQTIYSLPVMAGMPRHKANLIAFDPAHDFTVMPWLVDRLPRPMDTGDLLSGGRRAESVGEEVQPLNIPAKIYGKLGRTGVGPFDESFFATYDTVASLAHPKAGPPGMSAFDRRKLSAVLVRLSFGATPEQVRFAIARLPGVKVITGTTIVTATRQTTTALLGGMAGFTALMLIGALMLVSLIFSAIIEERRREIGLLRAVGSRRLDVLRMLIGEAAMATGLGGVLGIALGSALLLVFERSLVYHLQTLHVAFAWPALSEVVAAALVCESLAAIVGLSGALVPAWRASGQEPYLLIQREGG